MQPYPQLSQEWDHLIAGLPQAHLLQTWEWSQVKERYGWQPMPFVWSSPDGKPAAAAMVLKRTLPMGLFTGRLGLFYIPKGPLLDWSNSLLRQRVLDDLQAFARKQAAIFLKMDPDVVLGTGVPGSAQAVEEARAQELRSELEQRGWLFSQDQVQFRNTVTIDLTPSEQDLLAGMKQKTRYNVRLASRKGIQVRVGTAEDLPHLYKLYAETSVRDGFVIRAEAYYQTVWQTFMRNPPSASDRQPSAEPLVAELDGQRVAAVWLFYFAGQAYYLYGMSRDEHREKMPNYLLQWEAIRRAKALGCHAYNLWGAPDEFNESDGLWGVFRFKEGLGGRVVRTLGAWDYPSRPGLYRLYTQTLPRILDIMRVRGKRRTRQSIGG